VELQIATFSALTLHSLAYASQSFGEKYWLHHHTSGSLKMGAADSPEMLVTA
jgi:hypothetical protein